MKNPYSSALNRQFWKHGVVAENVFSVQDLWNKKFYISKNHNIATAGSCFAQHIAKRLMSSGYKFLNVEPSPSFLPKHKEKDYSYNVYSARYGNIYTVRQLVQLAEEVLGIIPSLNYTWQKRGRYYDPLRPSVEPLGFQTHEEVICHRKFHLKQVERLFQEMDVFIFTLGLTEYWQCNETGRALPTAPGTIAGIYNEEQYSFKNQTCSEVVEDMKSFMQLVTKIKGHNECKYLLTVSPVPLAATAENQHVLCATTYSKSVLRAAAGELSSTLDSVDYFPSYEIISAPWSRGIFYAQNGRDVVEAGVDTVMKVFFSQHPPLIQNYSLSSNELAPPLEEKDDDVICEEALLEGFAK